MLLELNHIDLRFNAGSPDEMRLFSDFSFAVPEGQFVSVIGSNGSGKSTLLNLICGTAKPDAGRVFFDGRDITGASAVKRAAWIGRVFQDPKAGTCAHLTILENLALADNKGRAYGLGGGIPKNRKEHYRDLLRQCGMGLENRLDTLVGTLSGGQRQALTLLMEVMNEPRVLLLDDHTAALDPKSAAQVVALTERFITRYHLTTIMITHSMQQALALGSRTILMHKGQVIEEISGKDKQYLTTSDLLDRFADLRKQERLTADMIEEMRREYL